MNIHEHQAKAILAKYGIPIPRGDVAFSIKEAVDKAKILVKETLNKVIVLKSQIHAGGRGKGKFKEHPDAAGGVRVIKNINDVEENARQMLNSVLVTHQTGAEGQKVKRLYIEEGSDIAKEYYLSLIVDRATSCVSVVASTEGGMDIEEVAAQNPEKIVSFSIDPVVGIAPFYCRKLAFGLGLAGEKAKQISKFLVKLYDVFLETDAAQIEINPLVETAEGKFIALDCKMNFDENALFRHPDVEGLRDEDEEEPLEKRASDAELSYVKMDGNIGCMVNGAGLAMATMDIIKLYGAEPANFLDVGGGATKERVTEAFKIILSDKAVEGILVNIFGGIMRCDIIAEGVIVAAKDVDLRVPLVVRLEGTNVEKGKEILAKSGLNIVSADDLGDAAKKIVEAVNASKVA